MGTEHQGGVCRYTEDDLLPLSALQHLLYCERQCALIHIEQAWAENRFTAEGNILHERVDRGGDGARRGVRLEYAMPLRSFRLGLIGKADVVEFHRRDDEQWQPFPVEYKRGKAKKDNCDKVQLCAQALCLEEMFGLSVVAGALFYGKTRRRQEVVFDPGLRRETEEAACRLHALIASGRTPSPEFGAKCRCCSLADVCLPEKMGTHPSVALYLASIRGEP